MEFEEHTWKYKIPNMWLERKLKNIRESEPVQINLYTPLVSDNRADVRVWSMFWHLDEGLCTLTRVVVLLTLISLILCPKIFLSFWKGKCLCSCYMCWQIFKMGHNVCFFCEGTRVNMRWRKEVRWEGGRTCRVSVQLYIVTQGEEVRVV